MDRNLCLLESYAASTTRGIVLPELPEVETVVRGLRAALKGTTLCHAQVHHPAVVDSDIDSFVKTTSQALVIDVRRRGKWILIDLADGVSILAHLRMTGQFLIVPCTTPLKKHDHVEWRIEPTQVSLRYNDVRRFGRMRIVVTEDLEAYLTQKGWGPEPFDVDAREFADRLGKGSRSIKSALLDQSVVAGLGNIYADEILFAARIDPRTPTRRIGLKRSARVHEAMIETLRRAIDAKGTSLRNYVSVEGTSGSFSHSLQVFRRQGSPCPRCGHTIRRVRLSGRSTHYCARCQR